MNLKELFDGSVVAQLDLPDVPTIDSGSSVADAVKKMRESKRGAIVVTAGGATVGIFTEVDFVKKVLGTDKAAGKIDAVMTKNPETVKPDTDLSQAFELMSRGNFRHLPVQEGKQATKLLAFRHMSQYLAERFPQEVLALPPDVHQVLAVDGG